MSGPPLMADPGVPASTTSNQQARGTASNADAGTDRREGGDQASTAGADGEKTAETGRGLARPPRLLIPVEQNHLPGSGLSPLTNLLASPYLDNLLAFGGSGAPSPSLQLRAMLSQLAQGGMCAPNSGGSSGGSKPLSLSLAGLDSSTPGGGPLPSPHMWGMDTHRSGQHGDMLAFQALEDISETSMGSHLSALMGGLASCRSRGEYRPQLLGRFSHDDADIMGGRHPHKCSGTPDGLLSCHTRPLEINGMSTSLYKGVRYNSLDETWQTVCFDGVQRWGVVAEYNNELEAIIANELMTPAVGVSKFGNSMSPLSPYLPGSKSPTLHEYLVKILTAALSQQQPQSTAQFDDYAMSDLQAPGSAILPLSSPFLHMGLSSLLGIPTPRPHAGMNGMDMGKGNFMFKGVRYMKDKQQYQAYVLDDDKINWLGLYSSEEEAARAHDAEAIRLFGPSANLNFSLGWEGFGEVVSLRHKGVGESMAVDPALLQVAGDGQGERSGGLASARGRQRKLSAAATAALEVGTVDDGYAAYFAALGRGGNESAAPTIQAPLPAQAPPHSAEKTRAPHSPRKTKFKGVLWDRVGGRWKTQGVAGGPAPATAFDTDVEAAKAYDSSILAAGRKDKLNFPQPGGTGRGSGAKSQRGGGGLRVTSQYKGVSWNSACSKWVAVLWDRELKRARHIGSYESEEDAARAYDREAIKMLGPDAGLNFRESANEYLASQLARGAASAATASIADHSSSKSSSQYRGVSWHERSSRWEVRVWGGGKQHFVGSYSSELEAAREYDKAVLRLRGQDARSRSRMNFPLSEYSVEEGGTGTGEALPSGGPGKAGSASVQHDVLQVLQGGGSVKPDNQYQMDSTQPPGEGARQSARKPLPKRNNSDLLGDSGLQLLDEALALSKAAAAGAAPGGMGGLMLGRGRATPSPPLSAGLSAPPFSGDRGATPGLDAGIAAVAAGLLPPELLPQPSVYYDETEARWAATLLVGSSSTLLGHCDTEELAHSLVRGSLEMAFKSIAASSAKKPPAPPPPLPPLPTAAPPAPKAPSADPGTRGLCLDLAAPSGGGQSSGGRGATPLTQSAPGLQGMPSLFAPAGHGGSVAGGKPGQGQQMLTPNIFQIMLDSIGLQAGGQAGGGGSGRKRGGRPDGLDAHDDIDGQVHGSGGGGRPAKAARNTNGRGGTSGPTGPGATMGSRSMAPGGQPTMRGKSNFRGVSWCEKVKKWRSLMWDGQRQRFLGHHTLEVDAARAYDRALIDLKGADAKTNFPASDYDAAKEKQEPPQQTRLDLSQNSAPGQQRTVVRL